MKDNNLTYHNSGVNIKGADRFIDYISKKAKKQTKSSNFKNIGGFGAINQIPKNNYTRDFLNGFFATLMATPCSAPFVGTALTFAFTQSSMIMIVIFVAMGVGMALPYLFISLFPQLIKFFPQPGPWMKYLKYFLSLGNLINHPVFSSCL